MRKTMFVFIMLLAALACAPASRAQDDKSTEPTAKAPEPSAHFYHLTLTVQELGEDGKPTNSRSYSTTVSTAALEAGLNNIRAGSKVPVVTSASSNPTVAQYQYIDVGINFDIRQVKDRDRQLSFFVSATVSSYLPTNNSAIAPVIRNNSWNGPALIPIGKPTVIFTSDSLESKGATQVVATATPIPE